LNFPVIVFSSAGFSDITVVTQGARVMVMIQMIGDLIVVGVVARILLSAVQAGLHRHEAWTQPD